MNKLLFGLIPSVDSVQTALNNLGEADFDPQTISIVMNDVKQARSIVDDVGPLQGVTLPALSPKLKSLGLKTTQIRSYTNGVTKGMVLIALSVPDQSVAAAEEMLYDYKTKSIAVI